MFLQPDGSARSSRALDYDAETALALLSDPRRERAVVGQLGQSLDGRIATPTGASKYINGKDALRHLHRLRAGVDAILVGVGTAIADDPALTTRHVPGRNAVRVVIDPRGRMPRDRVMLSDGAAPVLSVTCHDAPAVPGTEKVALDCDGAGRIAPRTILSALARRGLGRVLVEGGAETLARFVDAGAIEELHLMLAPIILGSGKTGLDLSPIAGLDEALRPTVRTMRFADGDMLCLCDLSKDASFCPLQQETGKEASAAG